MKVLIIGSGGREHTIAWKLQQSPLVTEIFCAPGNAGTTQIATNVEINSNDMDQLVEFAERNAIDLTVVGPEEPLVNGIVDKFREKNLSIIGPDKNGAQLEGSKAFAKAFMDKYHIPTAKYDEVHTLEEGIAALEKYSYPVVVKADGLAAGKGVFICESKEEAAAAMKELLEDQILGDAGKDVVIEEFLSGIETSILCFVDGKTIVPMVSSQDHKRAFDGDQGPNTGGMGTYSPNYVYTEDIEKRVEREILAPTLYGIQKEEMDYRGIVFIGLMITDHGPKVLEYNVRFGDPETQVVLPRLETDLVQIFNSIIHGKLEDMNIQWTENGAVCVILASGGYPNQYEKGLEITGLEEMEDLLIFHSGTTMSGGKMVTAGGRVLGVVAIDKNTEEARNKVYRNIDKIKFEGSFYRRDIGTK
ncbi:phosphoribosylamine--glycine ligase [Alkaliphilus oremlandii]|uniref:Phosphoribosylamine--glycine ligase n=1 Tax=Alkaliphilus oremlandii (strain OhILAs) TaxID=350688 RepID=A8MLJ0_ALKOO|nr:phosphoribosylamine--glycine ligase [Alkaliphilus oremlandii]ABW18104.1 phosphoribosylamine--glycine ligase [Alkaliphilus oremlandii OhILAs]